MKLLTDKPASCFSFYEDTLLYYKILIFNLLNLLPRF